MDNDVKKTVKRILAKRLVPPATFGFNSLRVYWDYNRPGDNFVYRDHDILVSMFAIRQRNDEDSGEDVEIFTATAVISLRDDLDFARKVARELRKEIHARR